MVHKKASQTECQIRNPAEAVDICTVELKSFVIISIIPVQRAQVSADGHNWAA